MMRFFKNFAGRTPSFGRRALVFSTLAIGLVVLAPMASATLLPLGPCPFTPAGGSGPACDATGIAAGTLLATMSMPFTTTLGTTSGFLNSAVYRETVSGTLDFYYQVVVSLTSTNCGTTGKPACDPIGRETDTDFSTWLTQLDFRTDCGTLCTFFVNGDTPPQFADRNSPNGDTIGFEFNPLDSQKIFPGHASNVLIVSTNAVNFAKGNASVIDGGTFTVPAFQPTAASPEPASFALVGLGLLVAGGIRRLTKARR